MRSAEAKGKRHKWMALLVGLLVGVPLLAASCGADDPIDIIPPPGTPTPTTPEAANTELPTPPSEFRVAYINLLSPNTLDKTNTVPAETFEERLEIVIDGLKVFKPDLVAFSEVTWTSALYPMLVTSACSAAWLPNTASSRCTSSTQK